MGLAASQARLLLLTARKSDLEYRAQMICQRKVMLAMQTEELAMDQTKALSNRALFFTYNASTNEKGTKEELLTYDGFTALGNSTRYRLVVNDGTSNTGKIVCKDIEKEWTKYGFPSLEKAKEEMVEIKGLNNTKYLQDMISSGRYLIQQENLEQQDVTTTGENGEEVTTTQTISTWNTIPLQGMSDVRSRLDDTDDAAASAEYEYKSLIIQNQDKQLDVELKQVETQQKACETEIDSVKDIMKKNIEKTFKTFA